MFLIYSPTAPVGRPSRISGAGTLAATLGAGILAGSWLVALARNDRSRLIADREIPRRQPLIRAVCGVISRHVLLEAAVLNWGNLAFASVPRPRIAVLIAIALIVALARRDWGGLAAPICPLWIPVVIAVLTAIALI